MTHAATGREGYAQLAVEVYGWVLLHTWLDRDLGVAGRLVVEQPDGTLSRHVARIHAPVCRVPSTVALGEVRGAEASVVGHACVGASRR